MSDEHQHDEDQDHAHIADAPAPEHAEFHRDVEDQGVKAEPEHAGLEGADTETVPAGEPSIVDEWGGDYPPGSALFCANFDADDFDSDWGEAEFPDGATVAIKRGTGVPPQGWIIRHAHLSDLERTKAILEKHASPDALAILYSLKDSAFDAFVEAWGKDGGMTPGKSKRSARRSGNTKRR